MLILQFAKLQHFSDVAIAACFIIKIIVLQSMTEKPEKLVLKYKFWIETDSGINILGEGKWKLLKAIRDTGSLKAAIDKMGYTYRKTWENLKNIEDKLGFKLIEKQRGGESGGQTILTKNGERFIDLFDKLYNEAEPEIHKCFSNMLSDLHEITEKPDGQSCD